MFRFTIRDVLWLMVVVGLACAWRLERNDLHSKLRSVNRLLTEEIGKVRTIHVGSEAQPISKGQRVLVGVDEHGAVFFKPVDGEVD